MKKLLFIVISVMIVFGAIAPGKSGAEVPDSTQAQKEPEPSLKRARSIEDIDVIFIPMPPEQPRLQLLHTFTRSSLLKYRGAAKFFLQIERPYDIGSNKGKIYISDRTHKKIIFIDLEKRELGQISGEYESAGIWVTDKDEKFIADVKTKQVLVFDSRNNLSRVYANTDLFEKPVDVAVYSGKIYVCDVNKHKVFVLDQESGEMIQEIGGVGKDDGNFYKPTHVVVDKQGNVYVNDFFNFRIQKFDQEGKFLKSFGYPGDTLGGLARPKGIDVDREGHLYVVDTAFENVQIFDGETGDLLLFFGGFGLGSGRMYMPSAIHVDYENVEYFQQYADRDFRLKYLVYVGNSLGPIKLNIFGFGEWTGAPFTENENEEK